MIEHKTSLIMSTIKVQCINGENDFVQTFIDRLINEGSRISCDNSNDSCKSSFHLPEFYDEDLFKRGQQFFHKHIVGMIFNKINGLIVVLAVPTILRILIMTKMSGTSMTAYRRYVATLLHMLLWYGEDFKPGSDLWNSLREIRRLHNSASTKGKQRSLNHISQMDMALTQFGFMGFAVCRSRKVGIHSATEEEWLGFIHVWRVIGYILGIEDRFNICRESVEETRQICNLLAGQVFKPLMEKRDKDFLEMTDILFDGVWSFFPMLNHGTFLNSAYSFVSMNDDSGEAEDDYLPLKGYNKINFLAAKWAMETSRYDWLRVFYNYILYTMIWFGKRLPILAVVRFGVSKSYVKLRLFDNHQIKNE